MKIAMIQVYKKLKEENLKSKLILQVHDEILIETAEEEVEKVKEIVLKEMTCAAKRLSQGLCQEFHFQRWKQSADMLLFPFALQDVPPCPLLWYNSESSVLRYEVQWISGTFD